MSATIVQQSRDKFVTLVSNRKEAIVTMEPVLDTHVPPSIVYGVVVSDVYIPCWDLQRSNDLFDAIMRCRKTM